MLDDPIKAFPRAQIWRDDNVLIHQPVQVTDDCGLAHAQTGGCDAVVRERTLLTSHPQNGLLKGWHRRPFLEIDLDLGKIRWVLGAEVGRLAAANIATLTGGQIPAALGPGCRRDAEGLHVFSSDGATTLQQNH